MTRTSVSSGPTPIFRHGMLPDIAAALSSRLVGQPALAAAILPRLAVADAGMLAPNRPAGVFMLLGPTGTGKTHSVEVLAEALHDSPRYMIRVDCGEFQMDHEIAKLIGAPPGYLGHRETQPWFTQPKMNAITSENCGLSIVLFDEIEKSAISLRQLILGVLDKATLRLGDSSTVSFEHTLIFMTSNCGAAGVARELRGGLGFGGAERDTDAAAGRKALSALRRDFSPEFINRIDEVIQFSPLNRDDLSAILDLLIDELNKRISETRLTGAFTIRLAPKARRWLLDRGTSAEYGARELRRTVERHILHPIAAALSAGEAPDKFVAVNESGGELTISLCAPKVKEAAG